MRESSWFACALVLATMLVPDLRAQPPSPYAGQQTRTIKALSSDEIRGYEGGKGMGFAKAAELNGYPGPMHVLELAAKLDLTSDQRERTAALFKRMEADAIALGRRLVDAERELDASFASRTITPDALAAALARIADLQARLRGVHLEAHLEQLRLMTPAQVAPYVELRGYRASTGHGRHGGHH
jgi:Spy/CpxP family protein refolding chaperone